MALTEKQKEIARNAINANRAAQGNKGTSAQPKSNFGSGLSSAQRALAESAVAQIVNRHEDNDLASIAANLGRDKKRTSTRMPGVTTAPDNIGAAALDDAMGVARPTAKTAKTPSTYNPYKSYNQPDGQIAKGEAKQTTKAYSDKRMQDEALRLFKEYGGKSYTEIQDAIAQNTGDDYMSQYQNQILTQIGQQNRTRADIEREIAETEAELEIAQAEWDRISNDVTTTYGGGNAEEYNAATERVNALTGRKEALEGELWMWDQGEIYSAVPGYSDFGKNSGVTGDGKGRVYHFINDTYGEKSAMAEYGVRAGQGADASFMPYLYMTDDEIGVYNYLYNVSGKEAADQYLDYLEFSLNERNQQAIYDRSFKNANRNFGTKVAASIASIPANLASGVGYLDVLGQRTQRVLTGSDKPIDYNRNAQSAYNFTQGAREGTMSGMSDTGKFIYSIAMSMGDSLGVLGVSLLTGGGGATMLLGGSAATSTMHDAKANGASDGQALAMGFIAGAAETIMEKLPLEKLLNITPASNLVEFIQNSIKQGANEAAEEVLTTLANTAADVLIMGDKNALMRSYEKYLAQGYTPEEAERLAKNEWWLGLAGDAFAGFLSGGMFGAGGTAIKGVNQRADRADRGKGISTSEYTLPLLIDHVEKGYTNKDTKEPLQYSEETKKAAEKIKSDLAAGKTVSNAQKGKLAEQILKDNAEFNEKVLPGILLEVQNREDAAVGQKDEMSSKEAAPKRNVVQTIRERLQKRADAKAGANNVDPAAAKILAQEVLNDKSTYSKKTRAAAERIINGETVNEADSQALVKGIKADNADFSGYTAEEIIAEASVLAQEEAPQSTGTETTAEIKTAVPQSTAQQTTIEGAMTNEQRTDSTGNEQRSTEGDTTRADRGRGRFSETYSGDAAPVRAQTGYNSGVEAQSRRASDRYDRIAVLQVETISSAEAGLENGSEDPTIHVAPEEAYDSEMEAVANDARKYGLTVKYFTGDLTTKNGDSAEAVLIGDNIWIKLDSRFTVSELYDHEKFHYIFRGKPQLIKALAEWITANYSEAEFRKIVREYYKRYKDVYNLGQLTAEEAVAIVTEEMLADAFAGTNKFGVEASKYTAAARAGADAIGATSSKYNANQGRAPPQGMTYDDVKQAVREVMSEVMGTEGNKNTAEDGGAKFAVSEESENKDYIKPITEKDVLLLRSVGRKSVGQFTTEDIDKAQKWAYKYFKEMGVKSPFFRAWFGEWRAHEATRAKYANIPDYVNTNEARKEQRGIAVNGDTGWEIRISREGETNTIAHAGSQRKSEFGLAGVRELIENSYLFNSEIHEHHSNNAKNDLIAFDHKLYSVGVNTNGDVALYRITVEEFYQSRTEPNNKKFHNLKYIEKIAEIAGGRTYDQSRSGGSTVDNSAINYTIADVYNFVKLYDSEFYAIRDVARELLNSDGTPKMLYHQTAESFTEFDTGRRGAGAGDAETPYGIFLKPSSRDIGLKGKIQMPLYATMKKPLVAYDRGGLSAIFSSDIEYSKINDQIKKANYHYQLEFEKAKKALTDYLAEFRKNNPDASRRAVYDDPEFQRVFNLEHEVVDEWTAKIDELSELSKKSIMHFLNKNGYDGVVLVNDAGSFGRSTETYIVLEPTQVKSAENNIGAFDASNPDIRFAISDEYDVAPEYRTVEDAEDENINAYAYDHPEVKQYYRRVAKDLLVDLTRVTSYEAESGWYRDNTLGNADTTEAITNLLEDAGMPYREIRSALEAYTNTDPIPEDLKADENLKFLEIEMDRLLREGYSTVFGDKRFASKRYIEAVEEAQNTELYDDMQFADEDFSQENEEEYTDVYPDEDIYTEDADQAYIERRERERAEELAAEEEAQREALQKRYEADSFFYAANQDEMSRAEETAREIIEEVRQDAVNEGFAVDEAQLKSIEAQTVEIESNNLRQSTLAWLIEEDEDIPDGVSEREMQAAVDKKIQTDAELKGIADEPMTFEESVAALEAKSDEEAETYLDRTKKKNFKGTEAMEALPLPIRIAKSVTNYETTPELMKRAVSNGFIIRNMDRKINAMKPTAKERKYARMVLRGSELASIPSFVDKERILDLAGYMMTKQAARNDTLAAQKSDIKKKYRALAVEQFKGMEKAKRVRLHQLNYMTPRRAMMELFGEEQGQKIYKEVFEPIRQNDAERTRFTQTMKSAAKNFVGSDGKSAMLTKEESALTQMLMEGVAAQELVAKMETETREIVEERAREILKERQEKAKNKKEKEENAEEENTEEANDYKDPNERAAQLYSVYLEVQEALNSGKYNNKKIDPVRINNAAEHFTEQYNLLYNAINEFRVAHGDQPIGFIKGYAPHMQSNNVLTPFERMYQWMAATSDIGDLPAEIAGRTHTFRPNSVYNRHFLPRGYESETEYNVYKGFEEYVEKVSQMFYHMDDIMRLRETSQYLRKYYVTEEGRVLLNGLNAVLDKSYDEKLEFLEDAKQISEGERLSAERVEEALENYAEKLFEKYKDSKAVNGAVVVWLDNYTNLLVEKQNAIDRGLEALIDRGGIKLVNSIINKAVSRSVVGNLSSVFSQTAQLPAIIAELGVGNTLEALRDFATRRNELSRFRYENDFLVTRKGTEMLDYATSDKIVNAMAKPLEMADFAISTLAARAAYYQGLRQGMDADAAMEYSVQKAENIMGSRNVASKPVGFSSKHPAMRLLNAFQIEAKNFVQHYSKDLPKEYKELVRKKGKMAAIKKIGGLYLLYAILAFLYNRGMEELTGKTPAQLDLIGIGLNFVASGKGLTVNDYIGQMINRNNENVFETELPEEFDWAGAVKSTGQMAIDEIPLLSNALSIAGFGDDQNIATSAIANAWDYFKLAVDDIVVTREEKENDDETDDESDVLNGVINFAKTGLQFVPGGNQAQKWIEGIMTLTGHGYKNKNGELVYPVRGTAWEWLQTMVIGKSALENAREYYASGASPLRSTRNEQYFAMAENGVDEEEAYRSAQIINDIESDKDENGKTISGSQMLNRMEYVMETDYPDEVKNLLAMSIATDTAHDRYVDNGLESKGVEAAAYVIAYAYHAGLEGTKENPMSADDKKNIVAEYLREQGVSANEISIILKYLD